MAGANHATIPLWTWISPVLASLMLLVKLVGVLPGDTPAMLLLAGMLLLAAVFAAVHHAEVLAVKLGEPFGSILLAVAVLALSLETNIVLGISPANMTLLVLTLFVSTLPLGTGRTTVLQGAVHLLLFAAFLLVSAVP